MINKDITVVIPIRCPKDEFKELIRRLAMQTKKAKEIIVINTKTYFDGSGLVMDDVYDICEKHDQSIKVIEITQDEFDHGGTRSMAMDESKTEYVLFMTQDAIPADKKLLEQLLQQMDEDIAVSYARQLPRKSAGEIEKYTRYFNYGDENLVKTKKDFETMGIKALFCSDVCAMYNRKLYYEIGGFPAKTIFNEDGIFAFKALNADYKVVYCSKARVYHSHDYDLISDFRRNFDLGVSQKQFDYIYGQLSSEGEGIKLVKDTAIHLLKKGKFLQIPKLLAHSGAKYAGYKLGKSYDKLSKEMVVRCSLNKNYWKRGN